MRAPFLAGHANSFQHEAVIPQQENPKPPVALVFWIIWFAILSGLVMIQFIVGKGIPQGVNQGEPPQHFVILSASLAFIALVIRFLVIPRIKLLQQKLPAMVIGLALSEAIGFFGLFLVGPKYPATQLYLFVAAIGCIITFAPFYAISSNHDGPYQR